MAGTQITQTRLPEVTDEGTRFQISAVCSLPGTLPSQYIFLRQVVRFDDPKDDLFLRVAAVTDFTDFGISRDECIANRSLMYRSNLLVQNYATVTEANDAWKELSTRVSALVTEYDTYINEFVTPPDGAVITYPTVDESTKTELINTYETAADNVADLEEERDEHRIECDKKVYELQVLQERLTECSSDLAALTPAVAALGVDIPVIDSVQASISSARAAAETSASALDESPEKVSILSQLTTINAQLNTLNVEVSSLETDVRVPLLGLLGTLQARQATLSNSYNSKQLEVNQCQLELAQAQAAVDTARSQRDAALAAVRAVCPDYAPEDL